MKKLEKPNYIDIFAGCGGISLGLHNAGWRGLFAIEKDKMAFETLRYNLIKKFSWPNWLPIKELDIKDVIRLYKKNLSDLRGRVDLIVGGPPCQGFSLAGKRDRNDERNKMVDLYIQFTDLVRPEFLFFENVHGFTITKKGKIDNVSSSYSEYVTNKLEKLGYSTSFRIIDFSQFGVPQTRKRFILVGSKSGNAEDFFLKLIYQKKKFLKKKGILGTVTAGDALSDLEKKYGTVRSKETPRFQLGVYSPVKNNYQGLLRKHLKDEDLPDSHRFANHTDRVTKKFGYILEEGEYGRQFYSDNAKAVFKTKKRTIIALNKNKPSPTLTTLPDDYIHYSEPRILTVREYARLQTFDDSFEFKGNYTTGGARRTKEVPRYTQIGNAIPPLFGEQAGLVFSQIK